MAVTQTATTTTRTIDDNGEIHEKQQVETRVVNYDEEPEYIKLYIETLTVFKGIRSTSGKLFYELCKLMSYAEYEQLVFLNPVLRTRICSSLGISKSMFAKSLKQLIEANLIKRIANNTFAINPNYVGKGSWRCVKLLRGSFDFITGDATVDFGYQNDHNPENDD